MSARTGRMLTTAGGVLGMLGVIAMKIGFKITLTPQMEEILVYKGLFAAAAGLLIVGAWVGHRSRIEKERELAMSELPGPSEVPVVTPQVPANERALNRD